MSNEGPGKDLSASSVAGFRNPLERSWPCLVPAVSQGVGKSTSGEEPLHLEMQENKTAARTLSWVRAELSFQVAVGVRDLSARVCDEGARDASVVCRGAAAPSRWRPRVRGEDRHLSSASRS